MIARRRGGRNSSFQRGWTSTKLVFDQTCLNFRNEATGGMIIHRIQQIQAVSVNQYVVFSKVCDVGTMCIQRGKFWR